MFNTFDITEQGFLHLMIFNKEPDAVTLGELNTYLANHHGQTGLTVAFDFQKVNSIHNTFLKEVIVIQRKLKSQAGRLVSINLNDALTQNLRTSGLDSIFGIVKDIESLRSAGHEDKKGKTHTIDVSFLNAFTEATSNIFSIQVGLNLLRESAFIVKADKRPETKAEVVVGTINMVGQNFRGIFSISISHKALLKVYEKMFKETVAEMNDDVKDALAELINMIYGQSKTILNDKHGFGLQPALPTILSGQNIKVFHASTGVTYCIPFKLDDETFTVEISSEK